MDIKMIVCDLDGTLLRSDSSISDYTLDVLEKCRAAGIKIAIATARPMYTALRLFVETIKPDIAIYNGGAMAKIGDITVHHTSLETDLANGIFKALTERRDAGRISVTGISAEDNKVYYTNRFVSEDFWVEDLRKSGFKVVETDFSTGLIHSVCKISARIDGPLDFFRENFPDVDIVCYRDDNLTRFAHRDGTKWKAIQACATFLGIKTTKIAAFGDDLIDVEMLANCGVGVAVENAVAEAKAAANFICPSNDKDGVARWLEENCRCR